MGQITTDTPIGLFLMNTSRNPLVKTVVEIGTWDGMGSTYCIFQGLSQNDTESRRFLSLEADPNMYTSAYQQWKDKLPTWMLLVHGRVIESSEMDSFNLTTQEKEWFAHDIAAMETCPNVLGSVPSQIDLLLLDGGEFSTQAEFYSLMPRSKIIVLDDTQCRKCKKIRDHVISNSSRYELIFDNTSERNGTMAFYVNENCSNWRVH